VPNDNFVNPGANCYFLANPSVPFNAVTKPYIGNLGTNAGSDPNMLRSIPQLLVNLRLEKDITPRLTFIVYVANLFNYVAPTAYQVNAYPIGPPGYKGGNAAHSNCYGQILALAGTVPCAPGLPAGTSLTRLATACRLRMALPKPFRGATARTATSRKVIGWAAPCRFVSVTGDEA